MIDYVELLANLDETPVLHEARLLLLLLAFAGDDNSGSIDGIAKLAKLDFLLRYPTLLKKALEVKGCSTKSFFVADNEKQSQSFRKQNCITSVTWFTTYAELSQLKCDKKAVMPTRP